MTKKTLILSLITMNLKFYSDANKFLQNGEVVCTKKTPHSFYFDVCGEDVIITHYWDKNKDGVKEIYEHHCTCKEMIFPVGRVRPCQHILAALGSLIMLYGPVVRNRLKNPVDKVEDFYNLLKDDDKEEFVKRCGLIKNNQVEGQDLNENN